jgi:hypothetical protein
MKTPKEKAEELINSYRIILMNEDTECGNEILCTSISKQCALIAVEFAMNSSYSFKPMEGGWISGKMYYEEVKQEIEKL